MTPPSATPREPTASGAPVDRRDDGLAALTIPAERLYWSLLDVPIGARMRPGPLPLGLRSEFEDDAPLGRLDDANATSARTMGDLQIICAPLPSGRIIACGAPLEDLKSASAHLDRLFPAALPPFIQRELGIETGKESTFEPTGTAHPVLGHLNLLVGELEPPAQRARRARRRTLVLATSLLALALVAVGTERRIFILEQQQAGATSESEQALRDFGRTMGSGRSVSAEALPAAVAVAQRTSDAAARLPVPADATTVLADLLHSWPSQSTDESWSCAVQSLRVTGNVIAATVTIEGDAAAYLRALTAPPGWMLDEPRLTTLGMTSATNRGTSSEIAADTSRSPEPRASPLSRIALTMRSAPEGVTP